MNYLLTLLFVIISNYTFAQVDAKLMKTIKDPTALVAGSFGGRIVSMKFKAARKIDIVGGSNKSAEVISYTFYISGKAFESNPVYLADIKGNLFTKEVLDLLKKSRPGTTIVISDIKVKKDNVIKMVPSITFILY